MIHFSYPPISMTERYIDSEPPVILWFRRDLRLKDHPAVLSALQSGRPIIPVYIHDESIYGRTLGAASKWWLHRSLNALDKALEGHSSRLIVLSGEAQAELIGLLEETSAKTVICSQVFEPVTQGFDAKLEVALSDRHVDFERHNATLLAPPGAVTTMSGTPFKVFTPYYRALVDRGFCEPHEPDTAADRKWLAPGQWPRGVDLDSLGLNDTRTQSGDDWAKGFSRFSPGEDAACEALSRFIEDDLADYEYDRDRPAKDATSHLSPHLRFGEISPQRVLVEVYQATRRKPGLRSGADKFRSELAWRDFCHQLLDQHPSMHLVNMRRQFDAFEWRDDDDGFKAWCRGETGYPLVDAGMREMWQTGYMHNRVRMVCASFLIKHLLIDWRRGEQWFWDCLVDADPANNPGNWQWVAGSGADSSPFYRVFNPTAQAAKFDPAGTYCSRYNGGQRAPIVDHDFARQRALDTYGSIRGTQRTDHDQPD
jgi:deoxyribodipyrimidine photo-lyase